MATLTSLKEEATLRDLLRWIESRDFNMTRRQAVAESQEQREEGEDSVRWLSYILDNDQAEGGSKYNPADLFLRFSDYLGNYSSEIQKDIFSGSFELNRIR